MSKYHFAETGLQTLQAFVSDGVAIRANDVCDVFILESKCPVELKRKGNTLQILDKEGETSFGGGGATFNFLPGGGVSIVGGNFRGGLNVSTVNGRTIINGIPAEEYQQRQAVAQKRARDPETEGSRFNRIWTLPCANVLQKITNSGSGDLSLSTRLLAPRCDISTESSGSVRLVADDNTNENKCEFESLTVNINSSGGVRIIPELHIRSDLLIGISSSGDFDAEPNPVFANAARLNVNGSGNITLAQLVATSCVTSINGSGDVEIRGGNLESLQVSVNGSGDTEMDVHTQTAKVSSNGSGDICLGCVALHADVQSRGSGDISLEVDEDCAVEKRKLGSGSIKIKRVGKKEIASKLRHAAVKAEVRGANPPVRIAKPPGGPPVYQDLPLPPPYSEN